MRWLGLTNAVQWQQVLKSEKWQKKDISSHKVNLRARVLGRKNFLFWMTSFMGHQNYVILQWKNNILQRNFSFFFAIKIQFGIV